jgi:hypothetical protein
LHAMRLASLLPSSPMSPIDVASVLIASGLIYCQAPTLMWLAKYMMSL